MRKTKEAQVTEVQSQIVENFQLDDRQEVFEYLNQNPQLIPLLPDVKENVLRYLPGSKFELRVETDIENPKDVTLFLVVVAPFEPERGWDKLRDFKRQWWSNIPKEAKRNLFVNLEYR